MILKDLSSEVLLLYISVTDPILFLGHLNVPSLATPAFSVMLNSEHQSLYRRNCLYSAMSIVTSVVTSLQSLADRVISLQHDTATAVL